MEIIIKNGIIVLIYDKEINICDTINNYFNRKNNKIIFLNELEIQNFLYSQMMQKLR